MMFLCMDKIQFGIKIKTKRRPAWACSAWRSHQNTPSLCSQPIGFNSLRNQMSSLWIPGSSTGVTATALSFTVSWRVAAMKSSSVFAASGVLCRLGSLFERGLRKWVRNTWPAERRRRKTVTFNPKWTSWWKRTSFRWSQSVRKS